MRFGQQLFAGAAAAGNILAAGTALAFATASGAQQVERHASADAHAYAVVTVTATKSVIAHPNKADAFATVVGRDVGFFYAKGLANAVATAIADIKGDSYGGGTARAYATGYGNSVKQTRQYPFPAKAYAYGQADAVTFDFGEPAPALAFAYGMGTTYYLGYGGLAAQATIQGSAIQIRGFSGEGKAYAHALGQALYTLGAKNTGIATATGLGDAAVKRSGIRYMEANGVGIATAEATLGSPLVYQSQTAHAYAYALGTALYTFGGKAHAMAVAEATGDGVGASTTVTGVPATCTATGMATPQMQWGGKGHGYGIVQLSFAYDAVIKSTKAYGVEAKAFATVKVTASRKAGAQGNALARAILALSPVRIQYTSSTALAEAIVSKGGVGLEVRGANMYCTADAQADAIRYVVAQGTAEAIATGLGFNQINDLVKAPADRTLYLDYIERLMVIDQQDRTVYV